MWIDAHSNGSVGKNCFQSLDPVAEKRRILFLRTQMLDKVQKTSSSSCNLPLSEPLGTNLLLM